MINERVRILRKHFGLTQKEFAEKLGFKQNSIAQIEIGNRTPSDKLIRIICDTFSANEVWIKTGDGNMLKPTNNEDIIYTWIDTVLETKINDLKHNLELNLKNMSKDDWVLLVNVSNILSQDCNKSSLIKSIIDLSESECEILYAVLNGIKNKI